ncbi:MAG: hypothetical protein AAGH79_12480, partial [Bacteroidota bacterium]
FVQLSYSQSPNEWLCQGPWLYVHTFTVESSAVIQSEEVAGSILAFHDYGVVEIDQNGQFTGGIWRLEGDQLMVRLGDKKQFTVKELQPGSLILEFSQTQPITGTFQYHFRPEQSNVVPSSKEMVKTSSSPPSSTSPPNSIQRLTRPAPGSMIQIELRGGGYQSKDNPVLKNELMIRSDGQIYFEYMKVQGERLFSKKIISESELEEVANFLFNQGFFELADHYTCQDAACSERLLEEPTPIPIQLAFQYGNYRKVVTLSIYSFEPGYRKVLNYPESIDRMIQAVRRIAE